MSKLFEPVKIRALEIRNRTVLSPMCMYSAEGGKLTDFHLVHLGRFALGGAGLIFVEATGVSPEGRITHGDSGLYKDEQMEPLKRIVSFVKSQGATIGIQLAHAGRKASCQRPWEGDGPITKDNMKPGEEAWQTYSSSAIPWGENWHTPKEMDEKDMEKVRQDFLAAAKRALACGFDVLEMHNAHGYLLQSFLSPIANQRKDQYGGSLENRMRFPLSVAKVLREFWPQEKPMFVRISSVDGIEGGFTIEEAVEYAKELKKLGVDVIDCSSGGQPGKMQLRAALGYQVPFAREIKHAAGIQTMAVGMIVDAHQANEIITSDSADFVALAREALNSPDWFFHAEQELGQAPQDDPYSDWPPQYGFWLGKRKHTLDRLNAAAVK